MRKSTGLEGCSSTILESRSCQEKGRRGEEGMEGEKSIIIIINFN